MLNTQHSEAILYKKKFYRIEKEFQYFTLNLEYRLFVKPLTSSNNADCIVFE